VTAPPVADVERFYRAGALGLSALEARERRGRRLGDVADATWRAFRGDPGELDDRDRLDLLLRDAAASHPLAFAPRRIFALPGLSEDEPFGHEWPGLSLQLAGQLLRDAVTNLDQRSPHAVLTDVAAAWGLAPSSALGGDPVANLGRASRVAVAGAGAVLALAEHFAGRPDLDLGDQALFLTERPGERQLFGMAVVLLGRPTAPRILSPGVALQGGPRAPGVDPVTAVLVSEEASPAAREAALFLRRGGEGRLG
jgi:hypothetical protein